MIPKNRLEFRTRGMLVRGHVALDENINFVTMSLLSVRDGWILGQRRTSNDSRRFVLIDKNLKEHKQKILSSLNIESIAIFDDSLKGQALAIYRKRTDVQMSPAGKHKLVLTLYDMREDNSMKYIQKK
jgi:hypothetical protein